MNLNIRYPIDNTYIPQAIAQIIQTGGVRFSVFQTALVNQSKVRDPDISREDAC